MEEASQNKPVQETKKSGGMGPIVILIAVLAIVGLGLAFIGSKNKSATKAPASASTQEAAIDGDSDDAMKPAMSQTPAASNSAQQEVKDASTTVAQSADEKVINVEAGSFYYKPNEMTVKKGQKVKIVMNSADMMHDFNIDELGVKMPIVKAGTTGTVEFTPDKVGTFEYYCSVGKHRQNGQVGKITVTE